VTRAGWFRLLLKEPLVHFLGGAGAIFALYALIGDGTRNDTQNILVSRNDVLNYMQSRAKAFDRDRFNTLFDQLTPGEREQLLADYIRDEALYREAKALNLDRNDPAARLRLIQQMEFITQDQADARAKPTQEQVRQYYQQHRADYAVPARVTFTHVFFSDERHGVQTANALAAGELVLLNARQISFSQATSHGDAALFSVNYVEKAKDLVARDFGLQMANSLFDLKPSATIWRGPFRSTYGAHLVLLTQHEDGYVPPLGDVHARVEEDARRTFRERALEKAIDGIVANYQVHIADDLKVMAPRRPR
jgi:hypothetical protein